MAFSPDSKTLVAAGDGKIQVWDVANRRPQANRLAGHEANVYIVAFSPDGKTLASGNANQTAQLWEAGSWQLLGELRGNRAGVFGLAFSPDGKTLATGKRRQNGAALGCHESASDRETVHRPHRPGLQRSLQR